MNDVILPVLGEAAPWALMLFIAWAYVKIDDSPRLNQWLTDKIVARRERDQ